MKTKKKANQVKEKALTKAELGKLYEEFKEKKQAEHLMNMRNYLNLKLKLELLMLKVRTKGKVKNWFTEKLVIDVDVLMEIVNEVLDERPTYTEPTLDEFMKGLKNENKNRI